jgi:hypothetical protein
MPTSTQDSPAPTYGSFSGNTHHANSEFSPAFGIWSGRIIMLCAIAVTLPVELALYPIAAAAGVVAVGLAYLVLLGGWNGAGRGSRLDLDSMLPRIRAGDAHGNRL